MILQVFCLCDDQISSKVVIHICKVLRTFDFTENHLFYLKILNLRNSFIEVIWFHGKNIYLLFCGLLISRKIAKESESFHFTEFFLSGNSGFQTFSSATKRTPQLEIKTRRFCAVQQPRVGEKLAKKRESLAKIFRESKNYVNSATIYGFTVAN